MTELLSLLSLIHEDTSSPSKPTRASAQRRRREAVVKPRLIKHRPDALAARRLSRRMASQLLVEVKEQCREASTIDGANPKRFPTTLDARLLVPSPGKRQAIILQRNGIEISVHSQVSIKELREQPSSWLCIDPTRELIKNFTIIRKMQFEISIAKGTRAVFVCHQKQQHMFFGPGNHECHLPGGRYSIQIQTLQNHGESFCTRLPQLIEVEHLDLSAYSNYRLVSKKGPLVRIQTASAKIPVAPKHNHRENKPHQCPPSLRSVYEYFDRKAENWEFARKDDHELAKPFELPPGRYEPRRRNRGQQGTVALKLYPSWVIKVEYRGQSVNLTPRVDKTYRGITAGPASHAREIIFHPSANTLVIRDAEVLSERPQKRRAASAKNSTRVFEISLKDRTG
jgi:hypothetical protein